MFRSLSCIPLAILLLFSTLGRASADPVSNMATITTEEPAPPSQATEALSNCIELRTAGDLDLMRIDLNGNYCLANDIDMSSIANFKPIGDESTAAGELIRPFDGQLEGRGHAIRNLTINSSRSSVGLFAWLRGTVKNVSLLNVDVTATWAKAVSVGSVGALAGLFGGQITLTYVSGTVKAATHPIQGIPGTPTYVGGLVGDTTDSCSGADTQWPILNSRAAVAVIAGDFAMAGGLAGRTSRCPSRNSSASGPVTGGKRAYAGGLVGWAEYDVPVSDSIQISAIGGSHATGAVRAGDDSIAGGLVGHLFFATSYACYATGAVSVGDPSDYPWSSHAGGLAGTISYSRIMRSFAVGAVRGGAFSRLGGLTGSIACAASEQARIVHSYAAGPVIGVGEGVQAGGLIGFNGTTDLAIKQSYAIGRVTAFKPTQAGGLIGITPYYGTVGSSYWDLLTSWQATSAGGKSLTTQELQKALPRGFAPEVWGITPHVSYPYLIPHGGAGLDFVSPLATTVFNDNVYVFLPIRQRDPSQYTTPPAHARLASLAAVYTMIARAIGVTNSVASLDGVKIDEYFWDDATQMAAWKGPVRLYASLGDFVGIPAPQPIGEANVTGPLREDKVVIIRGSYQTGGGSASHFMLATSFTVDGSGNVTALVADDPWTGEQVRIDPTTKAVIMPARFPLAKFHVNGFRVVRLKGGSALSVATGGTQ